MKDMAKKKEVHIVVPISEYDLELLKKVVYEGDKFSWLFEDSKTNTTVNILFKEETDEDS